MSYSEPKGWWAKNKFWFLPVAIIFSGILGFVVFIGTVIYFSVSAVKQSEPYLYGLNSIKTNNAVVELLGEPIKPSFFVGGSIPTPNEQGMIDLAITVSGSKGRGVLLLVGQKQGDNWHYTRMLFRDVLTTQVIDLMP